jgi:HEPN domain-containing protein
MSGAEAGYELWLKKAENDRLNIENDLAAQKIPWDTVCFHAQQIAEKLLKALRWRHVTREREGSSPLEHGKAEYHSVR